MLTNDFKLITKARAADMFGVDVKTIDNYIKAGKLPKPKEFVSKEYWHPDDFEAFLNETFRAAPAWVGAVTGVTATPAPEEVGVADSDEQGAAPAKSETLTSLHTTERRPSARAKDTNPVVRQRARQKAVLDRLNTPN